jgi:flagellar hook-basal body complex protein FliE
MVSVNNINGISIFQAASQNAKDKVTGSGFSDTLNSLMSQVNTQMQEADKMTNDFATGKSDSLHEVMIATEKSGISFTFLLQIRNKLLEFNQLNKMALFNR